MQTSFVVKRQFAEMLDLAAKQLELNAPQLHGYLVGWALTAHPAVTLPEDHLNALVNACGKFEFEHPSLKGGNASQEELPF